MKAIEFKSVRSFESLKAMNIDNDPELVEFKVHQGPPFVISKLGGLGGGMERANLETMTEYDFRSLSADCSVLLCVLDIASHRPAPLFRKTCKNLQLRHENSSDQMLQIVEMFKELENERARTRLTKSHNLTPTPTPSDGVPHTKILAAI